MTMKKSLIAMAVAGAVTAPATATAAEAYGFVFAGIDTVSADGGGIPNIFTSFFGAPQEEAFLADTPETRFGFKGSEDLGNGMTGSYRFEFGLSTDSVGAGGVNEDSLAQTRLAWVAVGGDWGQIKGGTMWGTAYEYSGWNVFRSRGHGGAAWYRMFNGSFGVYGGALGDGSFTLFPDQPSGLRVDNTVRYTYGGGGYSSDPFTFSVSARMDPNDNGEAGFQVPSGPSEEETFDALNLGAQGTFGQFTVNGFLLSSQEDGAQREPTMFGVGGRWNNGTTNVGLSIIQTDIDGSTADRVTAGGDEDGDPLGVIVEATTDFGGGWSGMAMVGFVDGDDAIHDMESNLFLQGDYAFSSRTHFQVEFEWAELDSTNPAAFEAATATDAEESVLSIGLIHNF